MLKLSAASFWACNGSDVTVSRQFSARNNKKRKIHRIGSTLCIPETQEPVRGVTSLSSCVVHSSHLFWRQSSHGSVYSAVVVVYTPFWCNVVVYSTNLTCRISREHTVRGVTQHHSALSLLRRFFRMSSSRERFSCPNPTKKREVEWCFSTTHK